MSTSAADYLITNFQDSILADDKNQAKGAYNSSDDYPLAPHRSRGQTAPMHGLQPDTYSDSCYIPGSSDQWRT
jgi:hypothetical protein